ncbi:MAG: FAD-binding oxidoreductase [Pseudomonadota bacterium]
MTAANGPGDVAACKAALAHLDIDDDPATVRQKSRDFFWYSPVLKARLDGVCADFVVAPRTEAEVIEELAAAHRHGVPVTPRGAGTGNYGQAMPLSGGMVVHLKHLDGVHGIGPGWVRAGAGIGLAALDRVARAGGQELRMHPSTHATATLGGFIAGGSGGVGSVRWGGLRATGNILSLRVVTCEAAPRVVVLEGDNIQKANHAYGVTGIITEVAMPLAPAYRWVDVIVGFDDVAEATRYGMAMAREDAILLKEMGTIAAPVPQAYFRRHARFMPHGRSIAVAMVAEHSLAAFLTATARWTGAEVLFQAGRDTGEALPPAYELTWNHTTLRALRVDPSITYLQTAYEGAGETDASRLAALAAMAARFGDEVPIHVEIVRFDGRLQLAGLPLVRYRDEARLDEIVAVHEAEGCPIFNPHRYTLEEGGMKAPDRVQLAFKREVDPKGLLNPGKMIAWDDPDYDFGANRFYTYPGLAD